VEPAEEVGDGEVEDEVDDGEVEDEVDDGEVEDEVDDGEVVEEDDGNIPYECPLVMCDLCPMGFYNDDSYDSNGCRICGCTEGENPCEVVICPFCMSSS
jgi:hypothetical protein